MKKTIPTLILVTVLLLGCGQSKVERKTAEFQNLKSQVEAGNLLWVRENAPSVMSLVITRGDDVEDIKAGESHGWEGFFTSATENYSSIRDVRKDLILELIKLFGETDVADVQKSIVEVLKFAPELKDQGTGTLKPLFELSVPLPVQVSILQRIGETEPTGQLYDLHDKDFLKDELCRSVGSEEVVYSALLIGNADFDVGILRCIRERTFGWGQYRSYGGVGGLCPMSLRRVSELKSFCFCTSIFLIYNN